MLGVNPRALREAIEKDLVPAVLHSGRWRIPTDKLEEARARIPPAFPSQPEAAVGDELVLLRRRLEDIERRLESLDPGGSEPPAGGASMRPALTPLFRPRP